MCCDCALVHDVKFRKDKNGKLEMCFTTNKQATASARRPLRKKLLVINEA